VAPIAPVTNWTGFYIGAQVGGAGLDPSCSTTVASPDEFMKAIMPRGRVVLPCGSSPSSGSVASDPTSDFSSTSFIGGGKIGYDWELWSHVVVGVVGDFDWTHLNSTATSTVTGGTAVATASEKIDWLASARGRLGWAFDNVLFYATGGAAWTQIRNSVSFSTTSLVYSDPEIGGQGSSDKTGVVAGGGFEYRVTQNVSVVGELLWYHFGSTTLNAFNPNTSATFTTQFNSNDIVVGTLGANYRF
jgi:outer membrane immunogenic protein